MASDASYSYQSPLAITRIPHDDQEGRGKIEASLKTWLHHLEAAKWPRALQYFENASYLQGNHFTRFFYDSSRGFGVAQRGQDDSSQYDVLLAKSADNLLIRPCETVVGLLTQSQPAPRVEPNSDLPEDEDAATLSEIVLMLLFERPLNLPAKLRSAVQVAEICGTAIFEVEYGETDIPVTVTRYREEKRPNPLYDPNDPESGEPEEVTSLEPDGEDVDWKRDIIGRLWTPFHITVDPAATEPEEITWIARTTYEDIDWIKDSFNVDGEGYYPENLDGMATEASSRHVLYWYSKFQDIIESPQYYQHGAGLAPHTQGTQGGFAPNQTTFTVVDVKPSRQFPKGRTLILGGGKLLYCGDARAWSEKYPHRWHPYAFFYWYKIEGKFWGVPLLSELVPLQKKINAIDALVHANRQYMAIGQWLIPKHCRVPEGMTGGTPGQDVRYTDMPGMHAPEKVHNIPLPQELLVERDQLTKSIDHIAATGMVGDQISKSAARAGVILDFLRQEKLRSKSPMIQCFEAFVETIAQNILIEIQLNLSQGDDELTRRIKMAAREYPIQSVVNFTGASIRDHHSVSIDIASDLMHSPEATEAKAMEYFQATSGQVSQHEREGIMKAIRLDKFVKNPVDASVRRARRMLSAIRQGRFDVAVPMEGIDDYAAMAEVFKEAVLDPRFMDYDPAAQKLILQLLDEYVALNEKAMEMAFQKQVQQQAAIAQAQAAGAAIEQRAKASAEKKQSE